MNKVEHLQRAAKCGEEAAHAVKTAARTLPVQGKWDYWMEQSVRMSRLAAWHYFKARPNEKPPDSYEVAVTAWKSGQRGRS